MRLRTWLSGAAAAVLLVYAVFSQVRCQQMTRPVPIEPSFALVRSVAHMTETINQGLSSNHLTYFADPVVARQLVKAYAAKGWKVDVHEHRGGNTWLSFSWPEPEVKTP